MKNAINLVKSLLMLEDLRSVDDDIKESLEDKERIIFSSMKSMLPDWRKPRYWDSLTDEQKINGLIDLQDTFKEAFKKIKRRKIWKT